MNKLTNVLKVWLPSIDWFANIAVYSRVRRENRFEAIVLYWLIVWTRSNLAFDRVLNTSIELWKVLEKLDTQTVVHTDLWCRRTLWLKLLRSLVIASTWSSKLSFSRDWLGNIWMRFDLKSIISSSIGIMMYERRLRAPKGPLTPVAPVTPVDPVNPVAPPTPVLPVYPVAPDLPGGPGSPVYP